MVITLKLLDFCKADKDETFLGYSKINKEDLDGRNYVWHVGLDWIGLILFRMGH